MQSFFDLSAVFGPMPSTMSRPPPATNAFKSGSDETLKRWCSSAAVFGPIPGISNKSSTVSGVSAVSRSHASKEPFCQ
jgi:hypothetical protein